MKMILAILRPECLIQVQNELINIGVEGLTVTEGRGTGNEEGYIECYRGLQYKIPMVAKTRIEIRRSASTGKISDGKIFVYALDGCTRVRTGETDEASV